MEDLTGKQFGHYQIVAPLGEGGMAAVYKAYQPSMERYVAVKVLPRHMSASEEFVNRFKREAKMLAQLQHPHILPVFDYGEADGYPYIVMPFVISGTLAELLQKRQLPLPETRRIIIQLGEALSYAHARGMIHRDIKPSNVLIDERGNCLLTDFGLARMAEAAATKITTSGTVMGTPAYMSPEQGMGSSVDQRSDIYSLGVILYEMVTGRVPYMAETPVAIVFKHIQDPLPSARKLNPNLPETVELVLLKALAKNPEDRYQTGEDFAQAIQRAIPDASFEGKDLPAAHEAIEREISLPEKGMDELESSQIKSTQAIQTESNTVQPSKFKRYRFALALIITLVIASGSWMAFRRDGSVAESFSTLTSSTDQSPATSNTEEPPFNPQQEPISSSSDQFDYSPAPTPLVLEGTKLPPLSQEINAQNASQIVELARWGKGYIAEATYSTDGTKIALATSNGIYVVDAQTLKEIQFIGTTFGVKRVAFSIDDESLIAVSFQGDILKFKASDSSFISGTKGFIDGVQSVSFSPDKSKVAMSGYVQGQGGRLYILSVEDGSLLNTLTTKTNDGSSDAYWQNLNFSPDGQTLAGIKNNDKNIYFWNTNNGALMRVLGDQESPIQYFFIFSPDGKTIASTSADGTIIIRDALDGKLIQTFEGHGAFISELAFFPDGTNIIYVLYGEGVVRIRRISDGSLVKTLQYQTDYDYGESDNIIISPNGTSFALVGSTFLNTWNIESGTVIQTLGGFSDFSGNITISADGKFLVSPYNRGDLWQIEEGKKIQTLFEASVSNSSAYFSTAGQTLVINSDTGTSIWNLIDGKLIKDKMLVDLYGSSIGKRIMALSPDGSILAMPNAFNIELWDINKENPINNLSGHTTFVKSLAFSPNGETLASGDEDKTVILWDISTGSIKHTLNGHLEPINNVAFSPDNNMVASSSSDGLLILWNVNDGTMIRTIELPPRIVPVSLAFSPNGQILALASDDGTIYLWQASTGELLHNFAGHSNYINGVAFSLAFTPDGKLLISSSPDGTIRLWGIKP